MPAITTGKVLVTGANGFIAVWLVKDLLEKGFSVRGTVRSESKGEHLKKLFSQYGDKLELVVVDDITKVRQSIVLRKTVSRKRKPRPQSSRRTFETWASK